MSNVVLFERAKLDLPATLAQRGHHIVYRANSSNHCPGCGRSQWYVGRITAECGFCGTAVPLAESQMSRTSAQQSSLPADTPRARRSADKRRFPRVTVEGRSLEFLVEGSPTSFALHNISAGGLMGDCPTGLEPGTEVCVRFEDGDLVRATVKWADAGLVGLAFNPAVDPKASAQ
jgi:hypothetical protein